MPVKKATSASPEVKKKGLTEKEKSESPDYVLNENSGKYVSKTSTIGKKIVAGEEVEKKATDIEKLIGIFKYLLSENVMDEDKLKDAVKKGRDSEAIEVPRSFPKEWGGRSKKTLHSDEDDEDSDASTKVKPVVTAYFRFCAKHREDHSDTKFTPKELGDIWKALSDKEKKPFKDLEDEDRERYIAEKTELDPNYKPHKKADGPTKTNAYLIYKDQMKTDDPNLTMDEIKDMWNDLSVNKKEVYTKRAKDTNDKLEDKPMSEEEKKKANDPENYILNPESKKYVKRTSPLGKKLTKAETKN